MLTSICSLNIGRVHNIHVMLDIHSSLSLAPGRCNRYIEWDYYAGQPDMDINIIKKPIGMYEAQLKTLANIPVSTCISIMAARRLFEAPNENIDSYL